MSAVLSGYRDITRDEIDAYDRDGALVLHGLVDRRWRERLAAAVERDIADPGPFYHGYESDAGGRFHGNLRIWQSDSDFRAFCFESPAAAVARAFLRTRKLNLLYDQLFVKESNTSNPTRWHNDQPYWPVRGWQVLSIWVALDPTTAENGALEFVRGSHRWGRWFQPEVFGKTAAIDAYETNPAYEPMPDIEAARGDYDIVTWDLEPGDAYVFHGLTVHGARGNTHASRRRRGYAVRYLGDDVVYDARPGSNKSLRNALLADGDPVDSDVYPVVFAG